ncbi:MAG: Methionine synthase activation domain [Firmicutes bacterium]|nr:Methionine synthase activation domain [Bacillota bacterium]MDI6706339.1 hypothetical protein [Bacillota bacterium]
MQNVRRLTGSSMDIKTCRIVARCPELKGAEERIEELGKLIKPVIYWADMPVELAGDRLVLPGDDRMEFESIYLAQGIEGARRVTIMAATIGGRLPQYSSACMGAGRHWEGTVADLLGSSAVEIVTDDFFRFLEREYSAKGLYPTLRYSPGYGDWDLKDQKRIIDLLNTEPDIRINGNYILEPVKSVTALVGWSGKPVKQSYPEGNRSKGLCSGEHTCSSCITWACKK